MSETKNTRLSLTASTAICVFAFIVAVAISAAFSDAAFARQMRTINSDPIPYEYSQGCFASDWGGEPVYSGMVRQDSTHQYFNNSSKQSDVYFFRPKAALVGAEELDLKIYTWSSGCEYVLQDRHFSCWIKPFQEGRVYSEFHFYKTGTDEEVSFKGTVYLNMVGYFGSTITLGGSGSAPIGDIWTFGGSEVRVSNESGGAATLWAVNNADDFDIGSGTTRRLAMLTVDSSPSAPLRMTFDSRNRDPNLGVGYALYNVGTRISYKATSDSAKRAGETLAQTHLAGGSAEYPLSYSAPGITGYTFTGWFDSTALANRVNRIGAGDLRAVADDAGGLVGTARNAIDVWGKYVPNTYKVHFNGNGATTGSTADQSMTYDVASALNANGFKRSYQTKYDSHGGSAGSGTQTNTWTFLGWSKQSSAASTDHSDKARVKNLTATNNATVNLHARWQAGVTKLPSPGSAGTFSWRGKAYDLKGFLGWYSSASGGTRAGGAGDGIYVDSYAHGAYWANGQTFHARWDCRYAEVTYVMDPGTSAEETWTTVEKVPVGVTFTPDANAGKWAEEHGRAKGANGSADVWYTDATGKAKFGSRTFSATPDGQVAKLTLYGFSQCDVTFASGEIDFLKSVDRSVFAAGKDSGATGTIDSVCGLPQTIKNVRLGTSITFTDPASTEVAGYVTTGGKTASVQLISDTDVWCYDDADLDAGGFWHPYQVDAERGRWHAQSTCADSASASVIASKNSTFYKRWLPGGYEGVRSE